MARTVKAPEVRRSEILDVSQRLFYQQGYEQTSVQDIITEIGIAKGTFYHYYGSKLELLDAIITRMTTRTVQTLHPLINDTSLSALEKFNQYFARAESWKADNKAFFLNILRAWFNDDNAIFRYKFQEMTTPDIIAILTTIIEQGIAEGTFTVHHPAETAEIVLGIGRTFSEAISKLLLESIEGTSPLPEVENKVAAAQCAVERVLGAQPGSITIFDLERTRHWFEPSGDGHKEMMSVVKHEES
jgi:AcrR family transcriptional regulator